MLHRVAQRPVLPCGWNRRHTLLVLSSSRLGCPHPALPPDVADYPKKAAAALHPQGQCTDPPRFLLTKYRASRALHGGPGAVTEVLYKTAHGVQQVLNPKPGQCAPLTFLSYAAGVLGTEPRLRSCVQGCPPLPWVCCLSLRDWRSGNAFSHQQALQPPLGGGGVVGNVGGWGPALPTDSRHS